MREEAKALSPKQCAVIELALDTIKVKLFCLHMGSYLISLRLPNVSHTTHFNGFVLYVFIYL